MQKTDALHRSFNLIIQQSIKLRHLLRRWLGKISKGKLQSHIIVFRLTDLTERQKLYFIDTGMLRHYLFEREGILCGIVHRGYYHLSQGSGDPLTINI